MQEPLGITYTVPAGVDPMPVYEGVGGVPVFVTDVPYLLSDGKSLESPVPVIDAGGPTWLAADGTLRDALLVAGGIDLFPWVLESGAWESGKYWRTGKSW